jgi:hypothetical protein
MSDAPQDAAAAAEANRQRAREDHERRVGVHRELAAKAEEVMATSQPTPTQDENDLLKVGAMNPLDIEERDAPEMPPLHDQRRQVAEATVDREADAREAERRKQRDARRPQPQQSERRPATQAPQQPQAQNRERPGSAAQPSPTTSGSTSG